MHPGIRGVAHPGILGQVHPGIQGLVHPGIPELVHPGIPGLVHPGIPGQVHPGIVGVAPPVAMVRSGCVQAGYVWTYCCGSVWGVSRPVVEAPTGWSLCKCRSCDIGSGGP